MRSSLRYYCVRSRVSYLVFLLLLVVAGCVGPMKPVPTAQTDEPPAQPMETAKVETPTESASPEVPMVPPIPLPAPSPAAPSTPMEEDMPLVEAKPVMVTAQRDSYTVDRAMSATKTDTPLQETPVSIQIVPRQVIDDQKTSRLQEALENVSGVRSFQATGSGNVFIIRGFSTVGNIYRNGLLATSSFGFPGEFDTSNIDSIEVLKGPAAVLFGRIQPGGLINVVTKRPLPLLGGALEQQFGSYDFYRTLWDVNAPITSDQTLSVRFAGAYQNAGSFRDFQFTDRKVFNPSVTWRPTESTTIMVDVEVFRQDHRPDTGIPVIGNRPAPVPLSRSYNDPNAPESIANKTHVGLQLDHRFNETWRLTNRFLASFIDLDDIYVVPAPSFGDALQADGRTLNRNIFGQASSTKNYATNLDLIGNFRLAGADHKLLLGFDYTRTTTDYTIFGNFDASNPAFAIDIFNPTYGIAPGLFRAARSIREFPGEDFSVFLNQWYGLYAQDQITLWTKLHILAGGRYDWSESSRGSGGNFEEAAANLPSSKRTDRRFSPRIGLLYELTPWLALYGNYVESLGTNNGVSESNQPFPPEIGKQREVGLKADLFDHRLNATLAFYHLTKNNVLTPDLSTPSPIDAIAVGEQRSRGIEFDMVGRVTEAVSLIGSYAYTDTRVTEDNSGFQGNRMPNVPLQSGSLWVRYDFRAHTGPIRGFSLGFGPYIAGSRHGDLENTFTLPGYVRLDGFAAYRWMIGPVRAIAQLTVRNLLNQDYYENADPLLGAAPRNAVYPGAPLTLYGSLRLEY